MAPAIGSFTINRTFETNMQSLWTVLTDPTCRQAWAGPSPEHVLHLDAADLRVGGKDLHRCGPKDDPEYTVETHWYFLDAPDTACFTETLAFGGQTASTGLVTYTLHAQGASTELNVHVAITSYIGDELFDEYQAGWTSALDRLPAYIASRS